MRLFLFLAAWGAACGLVRAEEAVLSTINPNSKADHLAVGLHVKSPLGELVVEFPQLVPEGEGTWEHPLQQTLQSDAASTSVAYSCGARFTYTLRADRSVLCAYSGVPAGMRGLWFPMMIPPAFQNGGRYAFGAPEPLKPFPATPAGRVVEDGQSGPFLLIDPAGARLSLNAPSARQGITDFRPGWAAFSWHFSYLLKDHPEKGSFLLHASASGPAR